MRLGRRGFTMLELVLASALAVVLTGGVLAVAAGLSRDRQRMSGGRTARLPEAAVELMRWDLTHATRLMQDGRGLTIVGNGEIDSRRLRPGGGLVRVTYRIEGKRLFREQVALDQALQGGAWRELVGGGVEALAVDGVVDGVEMNAPDSGVLRVYVSGGAIEVPWRR